MMRETILTLYIYVYIYIYIYIYIYDVNIVTGHWRYKQLGFDLDNIKEVKIAILEDENLHKSEKDTSIYRVGKYNNINLSIYFII